MDVQVATFPCEEAIKSFAIAGNHLAGLNTGGNSDLEILLTGNNALALAMLAGLWEKDPLQDSPALAEWAGHVGREGDDTIRAICRFL